MSTRGLSKARLGRMHDVLAGYVERGDLPGLVTLISRRGEVQVDALGTLAFGGAVPMRRDTIFRIASMTKPITAVAALILVEECRLRLDEPVDALLPELADRRVLRRLDGPLDDTVPANRPISLRDLLTLRMGFGHIMDDPSRYPIMQAAHEQQLLLGPPRPRITPAPDEWIRRVGSLPLMHQPGERWMYDLGLDVLGVLIARAAGQLFDVFLRERIFEPLGMKDTSFYPMAGNPRVATLYEQANGFLRKAANPAFMNGAYLSGGGGLYSTVEDYLQFALMLLNRGQLDGKRLLSTRSVDVMSSVFAPDTLPGRLAGEGFGLSVRVVDNPAARNTYLSKGSFGWSGAFNTHFFIDPTEHIVGLFMTQVVGLATRGEIRDDFETAVMQSIVGSGGSGTN
jgi:CubicO group peptidase (beta-lactamase class C family)